MLLFMFVQNWYRSKRHDGAREDPFPSCSKTDKFTKSKVRPPFFVCVPENKDNLHPLSVLVMIFSRNQG